MPDYPSDWSPLHVAVWRQDSIETVRALANSYSVNVTDDHGWTPVHLACTHNGCLIFFSQQVSSRGLGPGQGGRLGYRSGFYETERRTAMEVLRVLLDQRPNLHIRANGFCTPLHCAANSGWYSHVSALVRAGAPVYTGPECSPLCWAEGGSAGNHAVAIFLREQLGDRGLAMIDADHDRQEQERKQQQAQKDSMELRGIVPDDELEMQDALMNSLKLISDEESDLQKALTESMNVFPHDDIDAPLTLKESTTHNGSREASSMSAASKRRPWPRLKPKPSLPSGVNANGLCSTCAGMSLDRLRETPGYLHLPSLRELRDSAGRCKLCKIIVGLLADDIDDVYGSISQTIVTMSNGNHFKCSEPNISRTLDFKLSRGCTCEGHGKHIEPSPYFFHCKGLCKFEKEASVTIFTRSSNCHGVQQGTEIDSEPLSPNSLEVIRQWICDCTDGHSSCRRDGATSIGTEECSLPTRVIEVGPSQIRLVDGAGRTGRYLAFSHRWVTGPMPEWVTAQANGSAERRRRWFSDDDLPASVIDAIATTRKLEFQYVWIDSLCIIQDSPNDWATEASRMADVYANAYITIFADCAKDDTSGFLFPRAQLPSTSIQIQTPDTEGPLTINIRQTARGEYKYVQKSLFEQNVDSAYLSDRAWIFQERIMSRRILHFGRDQIFWECNEATLAEDGHVIADECGAWEPAFTKGACSAVVRTKLPDSRGFHQTLPSIRRYHDGPQWQHIVMAYSRLKLTRGSDKLPALSGLASTYAQRPATSTGEYIAGMWRENLFEMLSWEVQPGVDGLTDLPVPQRQPSFSWIAVDSPISLKVRSLKDWKAVARLVDFNRELETHDPYGKLQTCNIVLQAPVSEAISLGPVTQTLGSLTKGVVPLYNNDMLPIGRMGYDTTECHPIGLRVTCLHLLEPMKEHSHNVFLALVPVANSISGQKTFRRIGIGSTEVSRAAQACGFDPLFKDAKVMNIVIV